MILDTNAVSAVADGAREIEPVILAAGELVIPVVVLGEFRYGILRSRHRAQYEKWLDLVPSIYQIAAITIGTVQYYADIRNELRTAGKPIPANDLWIAALCRQHRLPLLSRDQHFDDVPGLKRIAW